MYCLGTENRRNHTAREVNCSDKKFKADIQLNSILQFCSYKQNTCCILPQSQNSGGITKTMNTWTDVPSL